MKLRTAFYALTLPLLACDDDEPPAEPTIAELAACDESDLDATPFMGPAFDENGALIAALPVPHVVATTVGWSSREHRDALSAETQPPMRDVFTHDGLLGVSFALSERCGSARTISLWRDDASRMKFVFGQAHSTAIKRGLKYTQGWETTHWSETASTEPPTWVVVKDRLDDVRGR